MKRISSRFFRMCGRVCLGLVVGTLTACGGGGGGGGGTGGGYEGALAPSVLATKDQEFTITFYGVSPLVDDVDLVFVCKGSEVPSTGTITSCNYNENAVTGLSGTWEHGGSSVGNVLSDLSFSYGDKISIEVGALEISNREDESETGKIKNLSGMASVTAILVDLDSEDDFTNRRPSELRFKIDYN